MPWAYQGEADGNPVNFIQVQFANDTKHLFGHVKLSASCALFSNYYTHLFVDTDGNPQSGYPVTGALFGSEMMIETGRGYDQRNGSFNGGSILEPGLGHRPGGYRERSLSFSFPSRHSIRTGRKSSAPMPSGCCCRIIADRRPPLRPAFRIFWRRHNSDLCSLPSPAA